MFSLILAVMSTTILAQPVVLPILSATRGDRGALIFGWFCASFLPIVALPAVALGFYVGWDGLLRAQPAVRERFSLPPAGEIFWWVAPILLLCLIPSVLFVVGTVGRHAAGNRTSARTVRPGIRPAR